MRNFPKPLESFLSFVKIENFEKYSGDITAENFFGFPLEPILKAEEKLLSKKEGSVAYFSMEYGLSSNTYHVFEKKSATGAKNFSTDHHVFSNFRAMDYYVALSADHRLDLPIYSGGLGVLAGDTLKSAADQGVSLAAVGILWNKGYFKQNFWFKDGQTPEENDWDPASYPGLVPLETQIKISLRKEMLHLKLWKYFVYGADKTHAVPLILLDSRVEANSEKAKKLTDQLYRSDNAETKILQRAILGLGGVKALEALGYAVERYHLNEGHAALAFVEKAKKVPSHQIETLKSRFAYTCHTPVAAGHDRFEKKTLQEILRDEDFDLLKKFGQDPAYPELLNFTEQAMNTSQFVNAVAKKHGEVTRAQFPQHRDKIFYVTNGIHSYTWVSEPFAQVFDQFRKAIGDWRKNPTLLKNVLSLKDDPAFREALWAAHETNKKKLCLLFKHWQIEPELFSLAWARRIAAYKRPSLILQDIRKLLEIAKRTGPIQILLAGKAHPKDDMGFTHINEMLAAIDSLEGNRDLVRVLMLENYDTYFAKLLASGVDVWLNNPLPPFEASGTSGMKAILNGVLQLSTLDGWVVEAAGKNIGWIFGWEHRTREIGDEKNLRLEEDSARLYEMLEKVTSLYYRTRTKEGVQYSSDWITKMVHAVSEAGHFSTHRMVEEYRQNIWHV
jgi:starch phosphorylase